MITERDYIEIPLGGRTYPGRVAIVDAVDADIVGKAKWSAIVPDANRDRGDEVHLTEYAVTNNRSGLFDGFPTRPFLHRVIMGITDRRVQIDHINRNGLDCRRSNLRICSQQENVFNTRPHKVSTSRFKGVYWYSSAKRWRAVIRPCGKHVHLGTFTSEADAAIAYDNAARKFFGEFAYLNFPDRKAS